MDPQTAGLFDPNHPLWIGRPQNFLPLEIHLGAPTGRVDEEGQVQAPTEPCCHLGIIP